MIPDWSLWWCCLSDGWRNMFIFMGIFAPPAGPWQEKHAYDLFFSLNIASTDSWLYEWFNTNFGVTFGEIEIEPGVTIEVAFWDLPIYLSFQLWKLDPGFSCPLPCPYTSGPFELPP